MKDIFTVTLFFERYLTTVSFTKQEDAIAYAVDEIVRKFPDEDVEKVRYSLDHMMFWQPKDNASNDDFLSIDESKLCKTYEKESL